MKRVKRSGRKYPRRVYWVQQRNAAFKRAGEVCEVSGELLCKEIRAEELTRVSWRRAVDHVWPEKFCRYYIPGADPHILDNLITVSSKLHARKTAVEGLAFKADFVGYYRELNRLGYSRELVERAFSALIQSAKDRRGER